MYECAVFHVFLLQPFSLAPSVVIPYVRRIFPPLEFCFYSVFELLILGYKAETYKIEHSGTSNHFSRTIFMIWVIGVLAKHYVIIIHPGLPINCRSTPTGDVDRLPGSRPNSSNH